MKAKKFFYHDDGPDDDPCNALLNQTTHNCEKCGIHPDTQSKAIGYHCPKCKGFFEK